jgi:hypothetical protein
MRCFHVTVAALALASCGSDNGSAADGAGVVPITPVATPAPTPTPTPTPTSTATPTSYLASFDFQSDRVFDGHITASSTQTVPARLIYGAQDSGTITYTSANQALSAFGTTIVPGQMGATLARTNVSLIYSYMAATSGATLGIYRASADAMYVSYLRQDELVKPVQITRYALIGAPTLAADLPLTATSTYRVTVAQIGTSPTGQTLVVDGANRRVAGSVSVALTGKPIDVSVSFQGTLDASTGRLDGVARTSDGAYVGVFHGRLYGPSAVEVGLIFNLIDADGNDLPGVLVGRSS